MWKSTVFVLILSFTSNAFSSDETIPMKILRHNAACNAFLLHTFWIHTLMPRLSSICNLDKHTQERSVTHHSPRRGDGKNEIAKRLCAVE